MGFRGQEGAYSAKWETLRDDVHEAELAAYEVERRVVTLERRIHEREHPIDARLLRVVALVVVVGAVLLAPRVAAERPLAPEAVETRLGAWLAALVWGGPALLHALRGRVKLAWASLVLRALVVGVGGFAYLLPGWTSDELSLWDLLALVAVAESLATLRGLERLRRPEIPRAPAVPQAPVGLDERAWRLAVEAMEGRVTFAHARRASLGEREPKLAAHLVRVEREASLAAERSPYARFVPALLGLVWLYVECRVFRDFAFSLYLPGFALGVVLLTSVPPSLRAWSEVGRPWLAAVFAVVRFAGFGFVSWTPWDVQILWLVPLLCFAMEPPMVRRLRDPARRAS